MNVAMLDLDTSHPGAFLPILRDMGHAVVAVWDGGTVWDEDRASSFAAEHGVDTVADDPTDVIGLVDAVFIHSVDWSRHVPLAQPFVEAGLPVFLDKPIVGDVSDLHQIDEWVAGGAVVTGGSALTWCADVRERQLTAAPDYLDVWCAGHPADYGVHGYALVLGLAQGDVQAVRHLGFDPERVELRFADGRSAGLVIGSWGALVPFQARLLYDKRSSDCAPALDGLYQSLLGSVVPHLTGERPTPTARSLTAPERAILAARASSREGGRWVEVDAIPAGTGWDGAEFASEYRIRTRGTS